MTFLLHMDIIEERSLYIMLKLPSRHPDLKGQQERFFHDSYRQLLRETRLSHSVPRTSLTHSDEVRCHSAD